MPNLAALHATIFLLYAKNRWGAHMCPPAVRGIIAQVKVLDVACTEEHMTDDLNNQI